MARTDSEQKPRRILIVDDHSMFRLGLSVLLNSVPGFRVVGEASSGAQAVTAAAALRPDVVLMDLNMSGLNGIEATERIMRANHATGVLVLTMFDDDRVFAAMRAGARGYILKTAREEEIVRAVHAVGDGEIIFGRAVAPRVRAFFASAPAAGHQGLADLTMREQEVLALIVRGEGNAAIARLLVLSPKTVRNHITSIFRKLAVNDRDQAITRAQEAGLQ